MEGMFDVLLSVRAVGLNFRDVLNVLGEYPGDPGPPGGDTTGTVVAEASELGLHTIGKATFGLADAPLASLARAVSPLQARKPVALSFEQASTLPVVWSTVHISIERALLHTGSKMLVHAATGGIGCQAVEYGHWLGSANMGTAGSLNKHRQLRATNVLDTSSSRDPSAFAKGKLGLLNASRVDTVLNSLSLDFISVSFALLGEGGAFEEIGKRSIWTYSRHIASSPSTSYCA
eukprot:5138170-Prymnesium_polylepis.1